MDAIAIYAGTFDPVTNGHLDIINRASRLFGRLIVAVGDNPRKKPLFSLSARVEMLNSCLKGNRTAEVCSFSGLLVEFARKKKARVLVRGLRELSDFEQEFQQALVNRKLAPGLETVLIITDEKYFYLNSTIVKELACFNGSLSDFVPALVEKKLKQKLKQKHSK